ncbi:MAG: Bro-N domain-containing protein [Sinobacteraceae bacterium]|nr:Bro-N domain-containing protein [Nevskiaceae bacterium]
MPLKPQQIAPFDLVFEGSRTIRCVRLDGEPWFVAADVLSTLHLDRKALERLDPDEKGVSSIHTPGGEQQISVVNEPGLYSLILRSRDATKPGTLAYRFRRWVTHEVLPALRHDAQRRAAATREVLAMSVAQRAELRRAVNRYTSRTLADEFSTRRDAVFDECLRQIASGSSVETVLASLEPKALPRH